MRDSFFRPVGVIFAGCFLGLACFGKGAQSNAAHPKELVVSSSDSTAEGKGFLFEILQEAIETVKQDYVNEIDSRRLIEGALKGMLASLDPFSGYLDEEDYQQAMRFSQGELFGIGVELLGDEDGLKVISVLRKSPADKAGIKSGDIITYVNGKRLRGLTETVAMQKMHGRIGEKIEITTVRNETAMTFPLTISLVQIDQLICSIHQTVVLVQMERLTDQTVEKLRQLLLGKIKDWIQENRVCGFILDLRNNPGGSFNQALQVSEMFLNSGVIVQIHQKHMQTLQTIESEGPDLLKKIPIAVLINKGTASSAEIIAAALKDNQRAIIIGERSFGKGSIQSLYRFPGFGAIKMTTAHFLSPNGVAITGSGVVPDRVVLDDAVPKSYDDPWEEDPAVREAKDWLQQHSYADLSKKKCAHSLMKKTR